MTSDTLTYTIERQIEIDAPIDVVWRTITEPDQIVAWFADRVEFDPTPGAPGVLTFDVDGGEFVAPIQAEVVEPPVRFAFRWGHPSGTVAVAGNSTFADFRLTALGEERTRVQVIETGLDLLDWAPTKKAEYARDHNEGWAHHLGRLQAHLRP